ncbi:MAG: hypothetical protein EXQ90_05295 [Rhodospirillales bacterium]|nr:hypothetical protein [Rhodospirillales bacterium]
MMVLVLLGAGCALAPPTAPIEPEGQIEVLGHALDFSTRVLPRDWMIEGSHPPSTRLNVAIKDGVPALRVVGGEPFVLARVTNIRLVVSPYLSWSRLLDPPPGPLHPVGLVIGFNGGDATAVNRRPPNRNWFGTTLPLHDRELRIAWGDESPGRNAFDPTDAGTRVRRYVRAWGPERLEAWRHEAIDLAALYAQAWPNDDVALARITYIGVAATADQPAAAYLYGIRLSR